MERRGFSLRILFLALVVPAVFFLTSATLHAQADTGSIQGTIKDQSGAVIPGAQVSLTNEGTNLTITLTAGGDGGYIFAPVKIGVYAVSAEAPGFAKAVQPHITLDIQQQRLVDLTLKPGAITQTIEVTGAPPALQTQNASVGQVVDSRNVNNLPLNGRNFTFLAQLAAGVNTPEADTRGNAQSGAFSANGLRPAQNNYLLDGIDNNSNTVDFLNGTNFVTLPPLDAIQEFKVQTSDYSAQFGRAGGAILNATIKSGTNSFHGTAWEYVRNDVLDAADWFEDAGNIHKGEYRQNQFGATIGGPIIKNKVFIFGDYEGLRKRQGTVFTSSVPTMAERNSGYANLAEIINDQSGTQGDLLNRLFSVGTVFDPQTTRSVTCGVADPVSGITPASASKGDPCFNVTAGTAVGYTRDPIFATSQTLTGVTNFTTAAWAGLLNQLPAGRIDPNTIKLLNLYPSPTNGNLSSNFADSPVGDEHRNAFDVRMDFNKGDKDQIFARLSYVDDPQYIPGPFGGVADGGAFQQGLQTANSIAPVASWTHTFSPTSVNEARLGYSRLGTSRMGPVSSQTGLPAQYGIADIPQGESNGGIPAFGINGLNTLGSNNFLPSEEVSETTQVADNFTKTYGKHTFKMGIEYQRVRYSTLQPPFSHGQWNYDGDYTRIPEGQSYSTGIAQFLLMPGATSLPASDTGAVPYDGGADGAYISNIARTDDGKNYWGTFFEDDFKVSSKLTLNLGLRWDYFGQTFERFGAQANFVPGINGAAAQFLIPVQRESDVLSSNFLDLTAKDNIAVVYSRKRGLGNSQRNNFGPRIGFAYQWTPKLVVRGGYGMFYDGFENRGYSPNIGENYPFQFGFTPGAPNDTTPINDVRYTTYAGTACANFMAFEAGFSCNPLTSSLVGASGMTMRGIQYNYLTPYTQGWNVTFQYELARDTTITMAYVGNNTHHIEVFPSSNNVNQILAPSTSVTNYLQYPDFAQGSSYAATEGSSYYNSLQTSFEKRYSSGVTFLATYTYGRARSDAGDLLNGGVGEGYRAPTMNGFGIQGDYRDANFDMRNVFHFSGIYELPFGPGKHFATDARGAEKQIIGGWSMNWNATVEGGQPITIGCPNGTAAGLGCTAFIIPGVNRHGSMTDPFTSRNGTGAFLNAAAFVQPCQPGTSTPSGCVPVPTGSMALLGGGDTQVSGPGITRIDFSLSKEFPLSERFRLQFRGEFFNILNHPTFMPPGLSGNGVTAVPGSTTYNNVNFGDIGATRFPGQDSRQIQFALRLMF